MQEHDIEYSDPDDSLDPAFIEKTAEYVFGNYWNTDLPLPSKYILDVSVVDDTFIQKLNAEYFGKSNPTDVIAFPLYTEEDTKQERAHLGQIIISSETARRQCGDYSNTFPEEMKLLLVHGMLHIAGWSEGSDIEKHQEDILRKL